jgi:pentose-5-phosphate-3-epimerase
MFEIPEDGQAIHDHPVALGVVDVMVAGTFIFKSEDYMIPIKIMKGEKLV